MDYRERPPRPELRDIVRCFWAVRGAGRQGVPERVVPDGCAEIVLNRAAAFRRFADDGSSHRQERVLLVGQLERALLIAPEGEVDLLGIRFEPGGLSRLLDLALHEITNVDVGLAQVRPALQARLQDAASVVGWAHRVAAIEHVLLAEKSKRAPRGSSGLVAAAVSRLARTDRTVDAIAGDLGVSRRTLERVFRSDVGLSPRDYLRICRLQRVIRRLERGLPQGGWAPLAVGAGYFDQSHMIRDFRQIAGTTPQRYLAEQNPLNDAFAAAESHSSNPGVL